MTPGLIERLEAAEGGSRELDAEVWKTLRPTDNAEKHRASYATDPDGYWFWLTPQPITTSLDAALALAARVLPGCGVGVCQADQTNWEAWIGARPAFARRYSTAPLALAAAILKARATQEQG